MGMIISLYYILMQNEMGVKHFSIVSTISYNYQVMLIGALQLQGRHYRESYILRSNQIANYWTTYGVQAAKEKDSSLPADTFHSAMQVFS